MSHFLILYSVLNPPFWQFIKAVCLVATDGFHFPQMTILCFHPKGHPKNSSLYLFCQEYLALLIALSFLKLSLLLALMTSLCPMCSHHPLCSFLCRPALLYLGIECQSASKMSGCLSSCLIQSSLLSNVSNPMVPNTLIIISSQVISSSISLTAT